MHKAFYLNLL